MARITTTLLLATATITSLVAAYPHREGPGPYLGLPSLSDADATAEIRLALTNRTIGAAPQRFRNETILWIEGLFDNSYSHDVMTGYAKMAASSGFSTVILAFGHVHTGGAIVYNNIPFDQATAFTECLSIMRAGNVSTILLSFGGAGNGNDFALMESNWDAFSNNLLQIITTYKLDGIDVDIEGFSSSVMQPIERLVNFSASHNWIVTGAPCCGDNSQWLALLQRTALPDRCAISWLNLQTYYGGAGDEYNQWQNLVKTACPTSNRPGFIVPGIEVASTKTPTQIISVINDVINVGGGTSRGMFIWDLREIIIGYTQTTAAQYFAAIASAYSNATSV